MMLHKRIYKSIKMEDKGTGGESCCFLHNNNNGLYIRRIKSKVPLSDQFIPRHFMYWFL